MIKLVAIDLDGTLLNSKSEISYENKKAIQKCLEKGIKVVISTGKSIYSVREIIGKLSLVDPQIVFGGTVIIDVTLKQLFTLRVPELSCMKVIKFTRKFKRGLAIGTTDGVFYYDRYHPSLKYITDTGEFLTKVDDLLDNSVTSNALLFTITVDKGDDFNDYLKSNVRDDVKIMRGGQYYLNVLNKEAGKLFGIKKILKMSGIKRNQIMAIGDSENDLSVIKFAGKGVAMGNSPEIIKEAADFIVSENDRDGVAEAIYKYVQL